MEKTTTITYDMWPRHMACSLGMYDEHAGSVSLTVSDGGDYRDDRNDGPISQFVFAAGAAEMLRFINRFIECVFTELSVTKQRHSSTSGVFAWDGEAAAATDPGGDGFIDPLDFFNPGVRRAYLAWATWRAESQFETHKLVAE